MVIDKNKALGLLGGLNQTATTINEQEEKNIQLQIKTKEINKNIEVEMTGRNLTLKKIANKDTKKNKTFYLKNNSINKLESISQKTGMPISEVVELAIEFLSSNLVLEGFDED